MSMEASASPIHDDMGNVVAQPQTAPELLDDAIPNNPDPWRGGHNVAKEAHTRHQWPPGVSLQLLSVQWAQSMAGDHTGSEVPIISRVID
jgi:hypothetical protein